jgi:hypothetical protein
MSPIGLFLKRRSTTFRKSEQNGTFLFKGHQETCSVSVASAESMNSVDAALLEGPGSLTSLGEGMVDFALL